MALRWGFKSDANWLASQIRSELGILPHAPLCPFRLADHLEYEVAKLSDYAKCEPNAVNYLRSVQGQKEFSAITLHDGEARLIVHNDGHHQYRQTANISHELAHALLIHEPAPLKGLDGARTFNREQEDEAHWLGPALLVLEPAALYIVRSKLSYETACAIYNVSEELLLMRLQVTGSFSRVARR